MQCKEILYIHFDYKLQLLPNTDKLHDVIHIILIEKQKILIEQHYTHQSSSPISLYCM